MGERLTRDLRRAAATLSSQEARFLVDYYYQAQENRKRAYSQLRALTEAAEPHEVIGWLAQNHKVVLEAGLRTVLGAYADSKREGAWAQSIVGIGPVLSAGLLAHIDIAQAPTAGHIWRFAGLDPSVVWGKGEKRPWNAALKVLCWKISESFVKTKTRDGAYYGPLYDERKAYELAKNERGEYADQAAAKLVKFKIGKDTEAFTWYSIGKLPPGHIHARAERWTVKLFLSHYQAVAWEVRFGEKPPAPFAPAILGHAHTIVPPNWPME